MVDSSAAFKADRKLGEFCIIIILQIQMAGQKSILLTGCLTSQENTYK